SAVRQIVANLAERARIRNFQFNMLAEEFCRGVAHRLCRDELPKATPAPASRPAFDEPAITCLDTKRPAPLYGAGFGGFWHRNAILDTGRLRQTLRTQWADEAFGVGGCADRRAQIHQGRIEIADPLPGEQLRDPSPQALADIRSTRIVFNGVQATEDASNIS